MRRFSPVEGRQQNRRVDLAIMANEKLKRSPRNRADGRRTIKDGHSRSREIEPGPAQPGNGGSSMAYKDVLRNAIRTFEDLEKWLTGQKARVDPRLRDVIPNIR